MLKIGFTIYSNRVEDFPVIAKHAEGLGFDRVWIGEHVVAPVDSDITMSADVHKGRARPPVVASDNRFYDLWTMVGAIAAATSSLKISPGIALLPLRHPLVTARACVTAYQLSRGRFSLGVGPGWLAAEFDALGISFKKRGELTDEGIAILRKTLAGGVVEHSGPNYPFPALQITDAAVEFPIYVGGVSHVALSRAARWGDGWVGPKLPFEQFLGIRDHIEKFRTDFGTSNKPFEYHMHMPSADADSVKRFEDAGFEYGIAVFDDIHPEDPRETSLDFKLRCMDEAAKRMNL
ncbi:MAG: LLM class flavin-dependent oxidoreductase [bacterium]